MTARFLRVSILAILTVALVHGSASAMYHPAEGRFMERDPLGSDADPPVVAVPAPAATAPGLPVGLPQEILSTADPSETPRCSVRAPESLQGLLPSMAQGGRLAEWPDITRTLAISRGPGERLCPQGHRIGGASRFYPDGPNLYQYAAGDPTDRLDPSGQFSLEPIWIQNPYACIVYMGIEYVGGQRMHAMRACKGWCRCYGCATCWGDMPPIFYLIAAQEYCCMTECKGCDGSPAGLTAAMQPCVTWAVKVFLGLGMKCNCN